MAEADETGIFPVALAMSRRGAGPAGSGAAAAIVADGRRRWCVHPILRARLERFVRQRFAARLARASFLERLVIEWRIRRSVEAILKRREPSSEALFLRAARWRPKIGS